MNNYHPYRPNRNFNYKILLIIGGVLAGIFILTTLWFNSLGNILMNGSKNYESQFTELTGVFESEDSIQGPVSGEKASIAYIEVNRTHWHLSSDSRESNDDFIFLHYKKGTTFNANGKKYVLTGTQNMRRRFDDKKSYNLYAPKLSIEAVDGETRAHDEIPDRLNGLDKCLDEYLRQIRTYQFRGNRSTLTLREQLYSNRDTITMRVRLRKDNIFLGDTKYGYY